MQPLKVVAVLAANPALSSLLTAMLAAHPGLRVRQFESRAALEMYMRLIAVDLLVADFDCAEAPAGELARSLRANESLMLRHFQVIALTADVTEAVRKAAIAAGIDEVIVKPMSPRYLLERVLSRLKPARAIITTPGYAGPERRDRVKATRKAAVIDWARRGDNIVPLFGDRPR